MVSRRQRLDADLVRRGLVASRRDAVELIEAGRVLVNGAVADKAARQVDPADAVIIEGPPPRFVSRGGEKLDAALDERGIDVTGLRVLDAGA
ncbi:MAG: 16S/23S rRNA (cytidine-2'-O)-methyltransferase, partial [Actinobacteria bacterium]|nr:16S/23S rRNA (cytidine-2'-O)-methyltransferase [Actinomycetota bacterium]